jgi:hypothetical protein
MARGWESKSVEEQQSEAASRQLPKVRLTPEQIARKRQAEDLQLARRHLLDQLQTVKNPRHRRMLEDSLAELDQRLSALL